MGYQLPTPTDWVTCDWACHAGRNPPSSEPGTDYGSVYGSNVVAVEAGTVTYTKSDNSGAMGRVVEYRLDDGRTTRTLHLDAVRVSVGQRVTRGQLIGISGASGYGSNYYYGSHAHQTLWPGVAWADPTIDFQLYTGGPTPDPTPDPTPLLRGKRMFIAVVNGDWYLIVPNGAGKPRAVILGGDSGAADSSLPVLTFTWASSVSDLKSAVDGL